MEAYDGVWLGGGHAKGVWEYLDSEEAWGVYT